jgi:hypothetical protein
MNEGQGRLEKIVRRTILECGTLAENILLNIFEVPQRRGRRHMPKPLGASESLLKHLYKAA